MSLKMKVDNLEEVDESVKSLYIEGEDGKFHLDVDLDHDKNKIPKSRLDQEITKRREAESVVADIAETMMEDISEEFKDLIPNLPPSEKIRWLRAAQLKGLFHKEKPSIDAKRAGDKTPVDFSGLNPKTIMSMGYSKK